MLSILESPVPVCCVGKLFEDCTQLLFKPFLQQLLLVHVCVSGKARQAVKLSEGQRAAITQVVTSSVCVLAVHKCVIDHIG